MAQERESPARAVVTLTAGRKSKQSQAGSFGDSDSSSARQHNGPWRAGTQGTAGTTRGFKHLRCPRPVPGGLKSRDAFTPASAAGRLAA